MKFIILIILMCGSAVSLSSESSLNIGVVDLNYLLNESLEGVRVKKELERTFNNSVKVLEEKHKKLVKKQEQLRAQKSVLTPKALEKKEMELYKEFSEFEGEKNRKEQELSLKENQYKDKMLEKIKKLVEYKSKKYNLKTTIDKDNNPFLYLDKSLIKDLTYEVLEDYNKNNK